MANIINFFTALFTGKGGTLRLAIFGSIAAGILYELSDSGYEVGVTASDGSSVTFRPAATPPARTEQSEDCTGCPSGEEMPETEEAVPDQTDQ